MKSLFWSEKRKVKNKQKIDWRLSSRLNQSFYLFSVYFNSLWRRFFS